MVNIPIDLYFRKYIIISSDEAQEANKMTKFEEALVNAEIKEQDKAKIKNSKKAYINDLVKQGVDKEIAKTLANVFFEYGIVNAM